MNALIKEHFYSMTTFCLTVIIALFSYLVIFALQGSGNEIQALAQFWEFLPNVLLPGGTITLFIFIYEDKH